MRRLVLNVVAMLASLGMATTAQAKWFEATSKHFVVYSEQNAADVRLMAQKLERFDFAMRELAHRDNPPVSPANRVTIFVVDSISQVQQLLGKGSSGIGGFYVSRAGSSYAIIPRFAVSATGQELRGEATFLHEYAHHFAAENQNISFPRWLGEGFAEFVSTARFEKDGSIALGLAGRMRDMEFKYLTEVPANYLLDMDAYVKRKVSGDQFYPRSWLLYHMLTFSEKRAGQLDSYLAQLAAGKSEIDSATAAFGNLRQLDLDLDAYARKVSLPYFFVKGESITTGPVGVRELDEGASAAMPLRIRSWRGVTKATAVPLAEEARAVAARYPGNAFAQTCLAEAEFDAGSYQAALSAAEAAIKAEPGSVSGYIFKGMALMELARASGSAARWTEARTVLLKANGIENDHPLPLLNYYRTYAEQGFRPTGNVFAALQRAAEVAPYDNDIRKDLAVAYIDRGERDVAIRTLQPMARYVHFWVGARRYSAAISKLRDDDLKSARELVVMSDDEYTKQNPDAKNLTED